MTFLETYILNHIYKITHNLRNYMKINKIDSERASSFRIWLYGYANRTVEKQSKRSSGKQ